MIGIGSGYLGSRLRGLQDAEDRRGGAKDVEAAVIGGDVLVTI